MNRTVIYIITCAVALSVAFGQSARASEVTGSLSTDGSATTTPQNPDTGGNATTTPQDPEPNQTPNPSGGSEVTGEVGNGGNSSGGNASGDVSPSPSPSPEPEREYLIYVPGMGQTNSYSSPSPSPSPSMTPTPEMTPNPQMTPNPTISDEEHARFALLSFGPRSGGPMSDTNNLSVGGTDSSGDNSDFDLSGIGGPEDDIPLYALVPRYGQAPIESAEDLTASAIGSASGLTIQQLLLIALVGLGVLASIGYAISRTSNVRRA